jgi:transcription-repair coupling factor (superfamily II helicase)
MATLSRLAGGLDAKKPRLLVTTVPALVQRVPPKKVVKGAGWSARPGNSVEIADLERYFKINGYSRASTVSEKGEFAIRGGVIDVFPPGSDEPVRLDLFGDTLESIRAFDPETQRSTKQLKEVALLAVSEALLDKDAVSRFRTGYLEAFGAPGGDPLYETISEGGRRAGMEHYLALFYPDLATLFDYLPADTVIALDHLARDARDERLAMVEDAYEARSNTERKTHYHPLEPTRLYLDAGEWDEALKVRPTRRFSAFNEAEGEAVLDMGARAGRNFSAERKLDSVNLFEATVDHAAKLSAAGKRVLFASWSDGSSERLSHMLADHGLKRCRWRPTGTPPAPPTRSIRSGWCCRWTPASRPTRWRSSPRPTSWATGWRGRAKRRRAANFLAEASALTPGDLVVHIDHGIARYEGLKTLDVQGAPHDTLELQYGGEAKLYLPVENIDLLTRYGADSEGVQLDRLGGAAWQARKARAKERLREMADGLIRIAAERATRHTDAVEPPHGVFDEFCARFPYEETEDQLAAIGEVLEDLGAGKPMDR